MSTTAEALRPQHPPSAEALPQHKASRPPSIYFPLGYKDAAYQWWTSLSPLTAERNVLRLIPHLREAPSSTIITSSDSAPASVETTTTTTKDPHGTRIWRRSLVPLPGKNRAINEICIERPDDDVAVPQETLVMLHGYGAGLGFFFRNLEPITRVPGLRLYALDMLGMGNSSRPHFKIHAKKREEQVVEAEDWFVDALEEWRKVRNLDRFTLLGHSLGGYLAVSYAVKYPGRLNKLILASPVGIPSDPYAVSASMPEPESSTLASEFTEDQQTTTTTTTTTTAPTTRSKPSQNSNNIKGAAAAATTKAPKRPLPSWLVWLWDANISPFSIIRLTGPLGPRFISGWSARRFNHLPAQEAQALHDYSFSIFKQKGSGEYALGYILAPGAYARRPIIDRVHELGRQLVTRSDGTTVRETGLPVVFLYGENDWMDVAGGLAAEQKLKEARKRALAAAADDAQRQAERGSARVVVVPKAGHHLYLDNPDHFNQVLREEMEGTIAAAAAAPLAADAS